MTLTLLPLTADDLEDVARIHIQVWREAYAGQVPQAYLDAMSFEDRLAAWRRGFEARRDDPRYETLLARDGGQAVGFISRGLARDAEPIGPEEIYAVYAVRSHWRQGLGFAMFKAIASELRERGVERTYLWVLQINQRARSAYTRWGGMDVVGREQTISIGGEAFIEIAVGFDLRSVAGDSPA